MINPGKYNKKLTFYKQKATKDGELAKYTQKSEKIRTCFGSVKATTSKESYEIERLTNTVTYDVRTRFQKVLFDDSLIIGYEGRRFEIRSVVDVREEHRELAFTCVEILKAGESHGRYGFLEY